MYAGNAQLVPACILGILAVVLLITWGKVHPFLALMLGSAVLGAVATMPPGDTVKSFVAGFGTTAGAVGILIALGAMIGKLLEDSGGANRIVATWWPGRSGSLALGHGGDRGHPRPATLLRGRRRPPRARGGPRRPAHRVSLMKVGIPALAGLSVLHGLVPPHPGPLTAIGLLNADLGRTLIFGILIAIPTVIVAGPLLARFVDRWVPKSADDLVLFGPAEPAAPAREARAEVLAGARAAAVPRGRRHGGPPGGATGAAGRARRPATAGR